MKRLVPAIALALTLTLAPAAQAQEVRSFAEDHVPPEASLADMAWLEGRWSGTGINGWPATESWLPPIGDTMVGTFVQADAEGGIMFSEHMYLMEEDGTLVLRLKHFNGDLTAWEDKEGMVTFRLAAIEPCAAYFRGLTLRCTDDGGLVAAVRTRDLSGAVSELLFTFARAD